MLMIMVEIMLNHLGREPVVIGNLFPGTEFRFRQWERAGKSAAVARVLRVGLESW